MKLILKCVLLLLTLIYMEINCVLALEGIVDAHDTTIDCAALAHKLDVFYPGYKLGCRWGQQR